MLLLFQPDLEILILRAIVSTAGSYLGERSCGIALDFGSEERSVACHVVALF